MVCKRHACAARHPRSELWQALAQQIVLSVKLKRSHGSREPLSDKTLSFAKLSPLLCETGGYLF